MDGKKSGNKGKYSMYESITKKLKLKIISQDKEKEDFKSKTKKNNDNIIEYKLLIIGDHLTGKTSFCHRFALNEFNLEIKSSTQSECYLKSIILLDKEIKVYLIDVINSINNLNEEFIKNVKGVFAIYDITKVKTFELTENLVISLFLKIIKLLIIFVLICFLMIRVIIIYLSEPSKGMKVFIILAK